MKISPVAIFRFSHLKKGLILGVSLLTITGTLLAQQIQPVKIDIGSVNELITAFENQPVQSRLNKGAVQLRHNSVDGKDLNLKLKKSLKRSGQITYYGNLEGADHSSFELTFDGNKLSGYAINYDKKKAYEYSTGAHAQVYLKEIDINQLVCLDYHSAGNTKSVKARLSDVSTANISSEVLQLQSLPGAHGTILLDFDGQNLPGNEWYGTDLTYAEPSGFSDEQIRIIYEMMAEDFSPFQVNVTTDSNVFNNTTPGKRIRVLFSTTSSWVQGVGGIANIGSFSRTIDEVPCWVFTDRITNAYDAGEAGSHEVGHTFGLTHDGASDGHTSQEYYPGHGNWGPIMGSAYGKHYSQWSKGEFQNAYNQEDDLSIIAGSENGVGYRVDDHANTNISATDLIINNARFLQNGIIGNASDIDVFKLVLAQSASVDLNIDVPAVSSNLKLVAEVTNESGNTLSSLISNNAKGAYTLLENLPAGTYYIRIDGIGQEDPLNTGFSDYASIGQYQVVGTIITATSCTVAAWSSSQIYTNGAEVSYQNKLYRAQWWTQGDQPDQNTGDGKPWVLIGNCGSNNVGPLVSLTKPAANSVFPQNTDITLEATASDSDGVVAYVEFLLNEEVVAKISKAPYTYVYRNIPPGSYELTAKAVDNSGAVTISSAVLFRSNFNPVANLTSHSDGQVLMYGDNITIVAEPSDADGQIVKAEFFVDGVKVGERTAAPWSVNFGPVGFPSNNETYEYPIMVVVTDNEGATGVHTSGTKVRVDGNNEAAIVTFHAPANNSAALANYSLGVEVSAIDTDGHIEKIELFLDGVKFDESSFSPFITATPALSAGTRTITAVATDDLGQTSSSSVTINATTPPSISIVSPAPMTQYAVGNYVTIDVNVQDDGEIIKVQYIINNDLIIESTTAPFSVTVGPLELPDNPDGVVSITAIATDNAGAQGGTGTAIKVVEDTLENDIPVVSITSPSSSFRYNPSGSLTVTANVSNNIGNITKVEIYSPHIENSMQTLTQPPYTATFESLPSSGMRGATSFVVKAYDDLGAMGATSIDVVENRQPVISIISPSNNAIVSGPDIVIEATATDQENNGLLIEFFRGGQMGYKIGEDNTSPYSVVWTNVSPGTYTYYARATDPDGGIGYTTAYAITIEGSTCTAPQYVENAGYTAGSQVKNAGGLYECKPYPYSGWCNGQAWAYAPGTGLYWQDAWTSIGSCARVGNIEESNSISVMPNPTAGSVEVLIGGEVEGSYQYVISDVYGEEIVKGIINSGNSRIDLSDYAPGLYTLKLQVGDQVILKKVIKQ